MARRLTYKISEEMSNVLDLYVKHLKILNKSEETIKSYIATTRLFIHDTDIKSVKEFNDMTKMWWIEWVSQQKEEGKISVPTINKKVKQMSSFYEFLLIEGVCNSNPCFRLPCVNANGLDYKENVLSDIQAKAILDSTHTVEFSSFDDYVDSRNTLALYMLVSLGLRIGELSRVKIEDVLLDENKLYVRGKGHKGEVSRYTNFNDKLKDMIEECIAFNPNREYLFETSEHECLSTQTIRKIWYKACNICGVEGFTPHSVRHRIGSLLASKGVATTKISFVLGHSKGSKTAERFYIRPQEDLDDTLSQVDIL